MRLLGLCLGSTVLALAATAPPPVTFHKDALPVMQNRCQECHRPGEVAPMSLMSYDQVRPWAKAIKTAVLTKKMPPWFADPHYGKFSNDRSMAQPEIDTLVSWAHTGAQAGNPKDAPKPMDWVEGWRIGKPDQVISMPVAVDVPASGTIDYQYIVIPTGFTEDKYVQIAEARPGNPALVHHIIAFIREPGNPWMREAKPGVPFAPRERTRQAQAEGGQNRSQECAGGFGDFLAGYA